MYCRKCGKKIPDDSVYCPYCSEKVVLLDQDDFTSLSSPKPQYDTKPASKHNPARRRNLIIIFASIIVIIGLIVGLQFRPSAYSSDEDKVACWVKYIGSNVKEDGTFEISFNDKNHYKNETDSVSLFNQKGSFGFYKRDGKVGYLKFCSDQEISEKDFEDIVESMVLSWGNCDNSGDGVFYWDGSTIKNTFPDAGCDICYCYLDKNKLTIIWAISSLCGDVKNITPPEATATKSGEVFVDPGYEKVCPLTVETQEGANYYIYLKYKSDSSKSSVKRASDGSSSSEEDMAFFITGGETIDIDVPIGTYELYYAAGDLFYGPENIFGHSGAYNKSEDLFDFYIEGDYVCGSTVTLYPVVNGNMETESIENEEFPR